MTPSARFAAAISVLDTINQGIPAEKALLSWSRGSRFAGSKDRAAVRDHVFDVLRLKRTCAKLGGGESGRNLVLGLLRAKGVDLETVFDGLGYGPARLSDQERTDFSPNNLTDADQANLPDDLWGMWQESLGQNALEMAEIGTQRGPICLRVNRRVGMVKDLIDQLKREDIDAEPHPECDTAVLVKRNERRLVSSRPFLEGAFELQDASSQKAMATLKLPQNARVLDFCAGGGGKSLALADMFDVSITASDENTHRMNDLRVRADRSGAKIDVCEDLEALQPNSFDVVLVDAPCSGSGTWRRTPDQKWRISTEQIEGYSELQLSILQNAAHFVRSGGDLFYATCSVFTCENEAVVESFLDKEREFMLSAETRFPLTALQDGFFLAHLKGV